MPNNADLPVINILHIIPKLKRGGMEAFIMNYYKSTHRSLRFTLAVFGDIDKKYKQEIKKLGGDVIQFQHFSIKNLKSIERSFSEFLSNNKFDIVHCHMANAAFSLLRVAKNKGINIRIIHSHQDKYADKFSHVLRNIPLVKFGLHYATHFAACSKEAGDFLFQKRKYKIIKNAIDPNRFIYNESKRSIIRKKHGVADGDILYGNISRFEPQKNLLFLLDVFANIYSINKNSKLILIGDGSLKDAIISRIKQLGIQSSVFVLDPLDNTEEYFSAFDAFVFPSKYEGLGIVCIEAQCSGLPVFASDKVPEEAIIPNCNIVRLPLGSSRLWSKTITSYKKQNIVSRKLAYKNLALKGYDLNSASVDLIKYYSSIIQECK